MMALNVNMRIKQLMDERGWTEYKIARMSGLSQSTVTNLFKRNTVPSIPTLEAICQGFGLTLAQFFADSNMSGMVELTLEQRDLFVRWIALTEAQKNLLYELIKNMK
jgi:transcriptional regulator with XRE-family HTH domain